jgi:hypothetical protein
LLWRYLPITPEVQDFSVLERVPEIVLAGTELSAVDDIWLTYFGKESEGSEPRWMDRWDSNVALPMLIRIQARFADGSEWPDFVVAPMLASGGAP